MQPALFGMMYISNKGGEYNADDVYYVYNRFCYSARSYCGSYLSVFVDRQSVKKYINSQDVRKEKTETRKSLGEVLKKYRTDNKTTQEFVAESLGVSRQAVSKWEQGISLLLLEMFPELLDRTFLYP